MRALFCFLLLLTALPAAPAPATEIENLLAYLGGLEGAVFIRNGSEYTAKQAAAHVRSKWEKQRAAVHTTEEFIELCASKSSQTGQCYEIRLKDGPKVFAGDLLRTELKRLRGKSTSE